MRLDVSNFVNLEAKDFRILTSIEVGMKNHEFVPLPLIVSISNLPSGGISKIVSNLHQKKLVFHSTKHYDGYKLTYLGLDYLALRSLSLKGAIESVGRKIGVGKEADVHIAKGANGEITVIKLHRLGRKSFRTIKNNRDYHGKRSHASWMYLSQIAAKKEFSYLSAMYENDFPVPKPIEINRHVIVMEFIDGLPLSHVKALKSPKDSLEVLFKLIIDMAKAGIVHGDFNEFNIIISGNDEKVYVIDFPQVIPIYHKNAETYFERDVNSILNLFNRKFKIIACEYPEFHKIITNELIEKIKGSQQHKIKYIENEDENDLHSYYANISHKEGEESDQTPEESEESDTDGEFIDDEEEEESSDQRDGNKKPIQIWHPHISRNNAKSLENKIKNNLRNKLKSNERKHFKQNKNKT